MSAYLGLIPPSIFPQDVRNFDRELVTALGNWNLTLKAILDRGISFDDNMDANRVSVTTHATPGTEFSVAHGLGKIPAGYIVAGQDGAGSVYDGATANTSTTLYLKSDVASKIFRLIVF